MSRAAWVNQAVAAWLIAFVVVGLPDSSTALEILVHGTIALLLLLASWRVLVDRGHSAALAGIQGVAGIGLALAPTLFGYPPRSFLALHDLVLGGAVVLDAAIEIGSAFGGRAISVGRS